MHIIIGFVLFICFVFFGGAALLAGALKLLSVLFGTDKHNNDDPL